MIDRQNGRRALCREVLLEGDGAVYLAGSLRKRTLAIKVLHSEYAEDADIARFIKRHSQRPTQTPQYNFDYRFWGIRWAALPAMEYGEAHDAISRSGGLSLGRSLQSCGRL